MEVRRLCTYLQSGLPYGCWGTNHLDFRLENLWITGSKSTSLTCIFPHSSSKEALLGYCTWTSTSSIRYFDCQGPSVPGLLIREPGQFPKKATNSTYWKPAVHIPSHPRILTAWLNSYNWTGSKQITTCTLRRNPHSSSTLCFRQGSPKPPKATHRVVKQDFPQMASELKLPLSKRSSYSWIQS